MFLVYVNDLPGGEDSYLNMLLVDAKVSSEARNVQDCGNVQKKLRLQLWSDSWLSSAQPTVPKMEHSERSPGFDDHLAGHKLLESMCEKSEGVDMVPSPSREHHIRRIANEVDYI